MSSSRPEPTLSELLRDRAIRDKSEKITASKDAYRRLLSDLFWALEGIRHVGELGSGLCPPTAPSPEHEARLQGFVKKYTTGGHSPLDLDLSIPPDDNSKQQPDPPGGEPGAQARPGCSENAMDLDAQVVDDKLAKLPAPALAAAAGPAQESARQPGDSSVRKSPRRSPPKLSAAQPFTAVDPPGVPPKKKSAVNRVCSLPFERVAQSGGSSRFVSPDYASSLPTVPANIVASRLLAAQPVAGSASKHTRRQATRSGLWVGSGGSEITKLGIKAQHMGVKSALRKNDDISKGRAQAERSRLNNVLTSSDWKTMLEELQMTRALEVLEKLKAEKAWAYTQLKKPRLVHVQKAHWDHLLDEMTWLQVDFRQERRWKIAAAYRLAKLVVAWHQADALGKQRLQVPLHPKREKAALPVNQSMSTSPSSPTETGHPSGPARAAQPGTSNQPSSELAPGDHLSPSVSTKGSPESSRSIPSLKIAVPGDTSSSSTIDKPASAGPEQSQRSPHESRKALHQMKRSRVPIFDITHHETVIDNNILPMDNICCKPSGYAIERVKLHRLFADLPLFGDLDLRPEKRPDEASIFYGRITRVTPHLESKPLLVSTLQPSRNCLGNRWKNLGPLAADDAREHADLKPDPGPHYAHLFSGGRKPKESKESNLPARSALPSKPPPTVEHREPLTWTSVDEELLRQACLAYDFNWNIVADVFNASSARTMPERLTPRDCYECWTRLNPTLKELTQTAAPVQPAKSVSEPTTSAGTPALDPNATDVVETESGEKSAPLDLPPSACEGKRSVETTPLFPNKRAARDVALQEIAQRLKDKRAASIRKPLSPGQPLPICLAAHGTHSQAMRPYMSPMEMSAMKTERDRQQQASIEMAKRQHQMQQDALLHQARAAALAAATQGPHRNVATKGSAPMNGSLSSRVVSQPLAGSGPQGRFGGLPSLAIYRQATQAQPLAHYLTSSSMHGVNNRGPLSPPSTVRASHPTVQPSAENQGNPTTTAMAQAPLLPQLPNMSQSFQVGNTPQPAPTVPTANHQSSSASIHNTNGLHNSPMPHSLTPLQLAQYLQQQQHLQQRGPEQQLQQPHHQHQQLLLQQQQMQQHLQQHAQHHSPPFAHQNVLQNFGQQSPQQPAMSAGHAQPSSGSASTNNSTPPMGASSSPLPQPPA